MSPCKFKYQGDIAPFGRVLIFLSSIARYGVSQYRAIWGRYECQSTDNFTRFECNVLESSYVSPETHSYRVCLFKTCAEEDGAIETTWRPIFL